MARKKETYTYLSKKKKPLYKRKLVLFFIFVVSIGTVSLYLVKASNKTYVVNIDQTQGRKKKSTFKKGVFKNEDAEISFNSVEIGENLVKEPIAYTFFSVTNKTKKPLKTKTIIKEHIEIYQDLDHSLKKLDDMVIFSSQFEDERNVMDELIKPGATVEVAYAAKLYKEDQPLSINFIENRNSEKIVGTLVVKLND